MLSFNKKYGKNIEFIIKAAQEENNPIPKDILNAPRIKAENMFYWNCFCDLGSERALGYGSIGPIPWRAINEYCDVHGIGFEYKKMVMNVVTKVDNYYLSLLDKDMKKSLDKNKGKRSKR